MIIIRKKVTINSIIITIISQKIWHKYSTARVSSDKVDFVDICNFFPPDYISATVWCFHFKVDSAGERVSILSQSIRFLRSESVWFALVRRSLEKLMLPRTVVTPLFKGSEMPVWFLPADEYQADEWVARAKAQSTRI